MGIICPSKVFLYSKEGFEFSAAYKSSWSIKICAINNLTFCKGNLLTQLRNSWQKVDRAAIAEILNYSLHFDSSDLLLGRGTVNLGFTKLPDKWHFCIVGSRHLTCFGT